MERRRCQRLYLALVYSLYYIRVIAHRAAGGGVNSRKSRQSPAWIAWVVLAPVLRAQFKALLPTEAVVD
jgi:hypothetical protein